MKYVLFVVIYVISTSVVLAEETEQITDEIVPFLYESRAEIPTADENLAKLISMDFRNARDEFTKHDLMKKIKPVLRNKIKTAKDTDTYLLRIRSKLGEYDFEKNTFPSGFSESTYVPFKNGYAVTFSNAGMITEIPIPAERAKLLSGKLQKSRDITAVIYVDVVGAKEQKLRYSYRKVLISKITKVDFLDKDNEQFQSLTISDAK